jgi:hypothetical protein
MKLPAWTRPEHPIARREDARWRRSTRKWSWLGFIVLGAPCACSALCTLSSLPTTLLAGVTWQEALAALGWVVFVAMWVTTGLWGWILGTFVSLASATLIASEREARNWSLLRLTPLSIRETLAAKLWALARLVMWPTAAVLGIESLGISLGIIGALAVVGLAWRTDPAALGSAASLLIAAAIVGLWPLAIVYVVVAGLINLAYNASIGLLSSALARTTGAAVGLSFVVSFGIAVFVLLPIQQMVLIVVQVLGGLLSLTTQSVAAFAGLTIAASLLLPIGLQAAVAVVTIYVAVTQAERIVE